MQDESERTVALDREGRGEEIATIPPGRVSCWPSGNP